MALTKVNYVDHQTVITADNLNGIQNEIISTTGYTTCATASNTAAKTAVLNNFVLTTGASVKVKFTYSNTASNPTLNINSTGAKPIVKYGATAVGTTSTESWDAGAVVGFTYDGTSWIMQMRTDVDAVPKSGGTFTGQVQVNYADGTTSAVGRSYLLIGNNVASGTAGNSEGDIRLYGSTQYRIDIRGPENGPSISRTIRFPDANGTIALDAFTSGATYPDPSGTNSVNYYHGWVTGSQKQITFNVELPKRYTGTGTGITPTFTEITVRGTQGYINYGTTTGSQNLYNQYESCVISKRSDYVFTVALNFTNALSNCTNNTPVGLYINGKFTFA